MSTDDVSAPFGPGIVDSNPWPAQLTARVVAPGPTPRIHGYAVDADLARHYGFVDLVLLALTGELPDAGARRCAEVALVGLSAVSIGEAPVHAAAVAQLIGVSPSSQLATGAIGLAEQARHALLEHRDFLAWLDAPQGPPPAIALARADDERAAVQALGAALGEVKPTLPALQHDLSRTAVLLALLHAAGLRQPAQLTAAWAMARIPCLAAEAQAVKPLRFKDYPMDLPRFRYCEGRSARPSPAAGPQA